MEAKLDPEVARPSFGVGATQLASLATALLKVPPMLGQLYPQSPAMRVLASATLSIDEVYKMQFSELPKPASTGGTAQLTSSSSSSSSSASRHAGGGNYHGGSYHQRGGGGYRGRGGANREEPYRGGYQQHTAKKAKRGAGSGVPTGAAKGSGGSPST